jgi:hypothetical protein
MTPNRRPPRLALALLERYGPDNEPLTGDLIEEFAFRQSRSWLWWQVLAAIAIGWRERHVEIRPLRLVERQPVDAIMRARELFARRRDVNLSASPVSGVGGIGLVVLAFLVTIVAPGTWWMLLMSVCAGILMGIVLIAVHAKAQDRPLPSHTIVLR